MSATAPAGLLILFLVAIVASAINTVAGGGSLLTFPLLVKGFGLPPLIGNATNSVCLWPGSLAGAAGYWNLIKANGRHFKTMVWPTLIGSAIGAWLLVHTPPVAFGRIVPWLILVAAVMPLFQSKIKASETFSHYRGETILALFLQFLVSLYGGYFGAGMGIMMLGVFSLTMEGDIHELNAIKNWLGLIINLVASLQFWFNGLVVVPIAIAMTIGSILGGYLAGKYSQGIPAEKLRVAIVVYGLAMAAFFFLRPPG